MSTQPRPPQGRPMTSLTVRIPATTANLGPGFDCLGLALNLENQVSMSAGHRRLRVEVQGEGAGELPQDESNLVVQAAYRAFAAAGHNNLPGLHIRCKNRIPTGSGLGSSAAAVLAGLLGANALMGSPLTTLELLRLGTDLEGHPDNIAAALFGGLVLVAMPHAQHDPAGEPVLVRRVSIPPPDVAVAVPKLHLSTREARAALPERVPFADAVYNLGRTLMVVEALRSGDLPLLEGVMKDRLHQPYRLPLIPGAAEVMQAARQAGAYAAALSGAGPGVVAFCRGGAAAVAEAMAQAFQGAGVPARHWALRVSQKGYQLRGLHG